MSVPNPMKVIQEMRRVYFLLEQWNPSWIFNSKFRKRKRDLKVIFETRHFQQYFSYIMATSFSGGRSRSTRREPPTMGKQLVNFITCGCESSAPFFVSYINITMNLLVILHRAIYFDLHKIKTKITNLHISTSWITYLRFIEFQDQFSRKEW
jgi:hypothetical protein